MVQGTTEAVIAQLKADGRLRDQPTTGSPTPGAQEGANNPPDFSKLDYTTEAGRKAFDDYVAANGKEKIQFPQE